jgi:hypothetical protein
MQYVYCKLRPASGTQLPKNFNRCRKCSTTVVQECCTVLFSGKGLGTVTGNAIGAATEWKYRAVAENAVLLPETHSISGNDIHCCKINGAQLCI